MRRNVIFIALGIAAAAGIATGTAASAHGLNTHPTSHNTSNSRSVEPGDDKGGLRPPGVSDDPTGHDVGDDHGGLRPPGVSDDPPGHDANDPDRRDRDRNRDRDGSDDPAGHDRGDDHGDHHGDDHGDH